jgi:hypothetical protein
MPASMVKVTVGRQTWGHDRRLGHGTSQGHSREDTDFPAPTFTRSPHLDPRAAVTGVRPPKQSSDRPTGVASADQAVALRRSTFEARRARLSA